MHVVATNVILWLWTLRKESLEEAIEFQHEAEAKIERISHVEIEDREDLVRFVSILNTPGSAK